MGKLVEVEQNHNKNILGNTCDFSSGDFLHKFKKNPQVPLRETRANIF